MNTILKRKISLSNDGSKKSKKTRVCKLMLTLELAADDDDDNSSDSAIGISLLEEKSDKSDDRRRPDLVPAAAPPAATSAADVGVDQTAADGDANPDAEAPAFAQFTAGLTNPNTTSTDDEHDESMFSEPSTHDDDPKDRTVRTLDLQFDAEDTADEDFWMPPFEREKGDARKRET
jgi:hypothetical protein